MIRIKKAKITSIGYMEIEYEETFSTETGDSIRMDVSKKCNYDPHQDLKNAFARLREFLVELCEQEKDLPDDEEALSLVLTDYKVTGFVIGGTDEHEGVTLIGRKQLAKNRVLNLVAPFTKWQDEHNGYLKALELKLQIGACEDEVIEYLNWKKAPNAQTSIEFPEAVEAEA